MNTMRWSSRLLLFISLLGWSACKVAKSSLPEETTVTPKITKPEDFLAQQIEFRTFSGKADMAWDDGTQHQNFTANIRMEQQKNIWASIMVLGIAEVARAYITPDSLKALVRIGKKAYALSYEEGLKLIQAQVEFPVLQNLIVGNPLISDAPILKVDRSDSSTVRITQQKDSFTQVLHYNKETRLLEQLELFSKERDFSCTIHFDQYRPLALKQLFAFSRNIWIENKGSAMQLQMHFTKAEVNVPVIMKFSIPDSYTMESLR